MKSITAYLSDDGKDSEFRRKAWCCRRGTSSCSAVLKKTEGRPWIGQLINHTRKETDVDRDMSLASVRCSAYVEITPYCPPDPRLTQLLLTCLPGPELVPALTMLSVYSRKTWGSLAWFLCTPSLSTTSLHSQSSHPCDVPTSRAPGWHQWTGGHGHVLGGHQKVLGGWQPQERLHKIRDFLPNVNEVSE